MTTSAVKPRRLFLRLAIAATALILLFAGTAFWLPLSRDDVVSYSGPTMGTKYTVRFVTEWGRPQTEGVQAKVDARLAEINQLMSTYLAGSELSRFNQYEGTDWFEVSHETATVVDYALDVAEDSGGAFDPTVGPLVNLWGFGPEGRRAEPPSDEQVQLALARVGHEKVSVRHDPPALRKSAADVYLDLSAVAKGYAVDQVSELLQQLGFTSSMVEIGGEVRTRGTKPGELPWRIGIEKPDARGRALQMILELADEAVATSGDYRNFFEHDGIRYSHTIHPATGRPVDHPLATVTVRAATCIEADALATALLVMGPDDGYDWATERDIAALFIARTAEGSEERSTARWQPDAQALSETEP